MTEMQNPEEVWAAALGEAPARHEERPPVFLRVEAWPYPDLRRIWVRAEMSPFAAHPNLELKIMDESGQVVSSMFMVEVRDTYQSVTLHLRREPEAGKTYHLGLELTRDEALLDTHTLPFVLAFRDPNSLTGV